MKKLTSIFSILLLVGMVVSINGQTANVETFGASPRDVEADTTDILEHAYNGLKNVGVETEMYIDGYISGGTLSGSQTWQLVEKPDGSALTEVGTPVNVDSARERVAFVPDVIGQYLITFSDQGTTDSLMISAGTFVGVNASTSDGGCTSCHSGATNAWEQTDHADVFERAMNGNYSDHFRPYCVKCHTTGYDTNADNNGFDDREFVYPDSLYPGQYDSLVAKYPDAMELANVQCESCHGPGSEHKGAVAENQMVGSLDSKNCAWCHDAGTYHVFPYQWQTSGHASVPPYPGGSRTYCGGCHDGRQFIQFANGEEITAQSETTNITCAVCHDPHSAENPHQVRLMTATLSDGHEVEQGGTGKLCMNCHKSRREADSYTEEPHDHYGPHYVPQADMLIGRNAVDFGMELPTSAHYASIEDACATCHMAAFEDMDGGGGHSFAVVDNEGNDRVQICTDCHGDVGETFEVKKYYANGNGDHDGDGEVEGLQDEVKGLMEELAGMLPAAEGHDAYDPHDAVDETWNKTQLKAAYNYEMVYYDHSYGLHNPAFTVSLLKTSIKALEVGQLGPGVIESVTDVPNDQGYQVNVVWTKFGGDGVSNDPILNYAVWRKMEDGQLAKNANVYTDLSEIPNDENNLNGAIYRTQDDHLWTFVEAVPAAGQMYYSAVVPTVYNTVEGDTAWTEFKVMGLTANPANNVTSEPKAGHSVDNLDPMVPGGLAAGATEDAIELSWEDPVDEDFQYFNVYRSTEQGFDPSQTEPLAQVTKPSYEDMEAQEGETYYYKVSATDFNKNESDYSAEVNATITDVKVEGGIPDEYALKQNYPNPFNPSTIIKYQLPEASNVKITVFDITGKEIATLVDKQMNAGYHYTVWNAHNISTGIYFYRMQTDNFVKVQKMILMK